MSEKQTDRQSPAFLTLFLPAWKTQAPASHLEQWLTPELIELIFLLGLKFKLIKPYVPFSDYTKEGS